jgi:hypothetical protein
MARVETMLDFSRIEAGRRPCHLPPQIEAPEKGVLTQCARRPARLRQDHAGATDRHHPAAALLEEALECAQIHSISGLLPTNAALITTRPFRSAHHSVPDAGQIGGGSNARRAK